MQVLFFVPISIFVYVEIDLQLRYFPLHRRLLFGKYLSVVVYVYKGIVTSPRSVIIPVVTLTPGKVISVNPATAEKLTE